MKKSIASILAILSITTYAGVNDTPNDGTSLLDDLTSTSRVVVDAFLNSSNRVHDLIESVSPRTSLEPATNYTDDVASYIAQDATNYTDRSSAIALQAANDYTTNKVLSLKSELEREISSVPVITTNDVCAIVTNTVSVDTGEFGPWKFNISGDFEVVEQYISDGPDPYWEYTLYASGQAIGGTGYDDRLTVIDWGDYFPNLISTRVRITVTRNALGLARLNDLPPLTNGLISADFIATNNPAFVAAVTNCPVAIAEGDAEALAEWGIYGGGGTIGALLAALAAAVAALRKKKMPLYPVGGSGNPVNATYESGVLTVSPFSMAAYAPSASAAFSVAMGSLPSDFESGKARDAVLVIDCSLLSDGDEPTVTWGTNFHPRTDAGTDFACEVGVRNVYYISEYASGEFAVGGWTETAGGNA